MIDVLQPLNELETFETNGVVFLLFNNNSDLFYYICFVSGFGGLCVVLLLFILDNNDW